MAEIVSEDGAAKPGAAPQQPFFRAGRQEILAHQRRFGLAYTLLAIGVGAAVGLGIVLIGRGSSHQPATGSQTFKPVQSGELGAKEIARHVGREYRQKDGSQLAAVIGERPNFQGQPLSFYLIRPHDAQDPNRDIAIFTVGEGIMYTMCGFGKNCGTPGAGTNAAEDLLLKREALELSLDTFKSDPSVQSVTTLLPPLQQGQLAIIFSRQELADWIGRPLGGILSPASRIKPGQVGSAEEARIDTIEAGSIYAYDAVQGPDGNALFRLDPIG